MSPDHVFGGSAMAARPRGAPGAEDHGRVDADFRPLGQGDRLNAGDGRRLQQCADIAADAQRVFRLLQELLAVSL